VGRKHVAIYSKVTLTAEKDILVVGAGVCVLPQLRVMTLTCVQSQALKGLSKLKYEFK
jgi:hypothetical protein